MKEIRTIMIRIDNRLLFDKTVNTSIANGWELKKRTIIPNTQCSDLAQSVFYAELERDCI